MVIAKAIRGLQALGRSAWSSVRGVKVWPAANSEPDYLMAVRGVAVIGVALGHILGNGSLSLGALVSKGSSAYEFHAQRFEWWRSILEILTPLIGENFVLLFFVQSGYLMGKVFFDGRYDALTQKRSFFAARFLRLAPLLYFNLIICLFLFPYNFHDPIRILGDFLFITNLTGRSINLVTWSLSHEAQYYLLCPFVFLLFRRGTRGGLVAAVALTVAAYGLPRLFSILAPFKYIYTFLGGFTVNLILANFPLSLSHAQKRVGLIAGIAVIHLGYNFLFLFGYVAAANFIAVAGSIALVTICEANSTTPATNSWIIQFAVFMGFLTYGFYLWHYPILQFSVATIEQAARAVSAGLPSYGFAIFCFHALGILVIGVCTLVVSLLTYAFIETTFRPSLYNSLMRIRRTVSVR